MLTAVRMVPLRVWNCSEHGCIPGDGNKPESAAGGSLKTEVKVTPPLGASLAAIQRALSRRLLLFEEMSAVKSEDVLWAETTSDYTDDRPGHTFTPGNKAAFVSNLAQTIIARGNRVALFVRYRLGAEGLCELLQARGFSSNYLHSGCQSHATVLNQFRTGPPSALVVTRQLFGRGFDLPEADSAIFFSPKRDERTMWQEALRIRSRVGNRKDVYIFYFAWTTEAAKWANLRAKIDPSGSQPGQTLCLDLRCEEG
jgi:superfamily II DNA/RNA helicase